MKCFLAKTRDTTNAWKRSCSGPEEDQRPVPWSMYQTVLDKAWAIYVEVIEALQDKGLLFRDGKSCHSVLPVLEH